VQGLEDQVIVRAMAPFGMCLEVPVDHPDGLAREEAARQETRAVRRCDREIIAAVNDPRDASLTIPVVVGILGGRVASSDRVFHVDGPETRAQEGFPILPWHQAPRDPAVPDPPRPCRTASSWITPCLPPPPAPDDHGIVHPRARERLCIPARIHLEHAGHKSATRWLPTSGRLVPFLASPRR
jgi:hypothetical protein